MNNKYLFDTTVFNRIYDNQEWLEILIIAKEKDSQFFFSEFQEFELAGMGAKTYDENCVSNQANIPIDKRLFFSRMMSSLNMKQASSTACLMPNHWVLDGSIHPDEHPKLTESILALNERIREKHPFAQHYDALTAETAVYNDCMLVTDDIDLKNMVNEYKSGSAITTIELINELAER